MTKKILNGKQSFSLWMNGDALMPCSCYTCSSFLSFQIFKFNFLFNTQVHKEIQRYISIISTMQKYT